MDVEQHKAPLLTIDTLLPLLKGVKNWRLLAKGLIIANDHDDDLRYAESEDLDALQRQHGSDEECLKYVIEKFLQGKGGRYKQLSWRAVIWSLYEANEIQLASHIKSYGEPLQDASLTVDSLTKVMEMVPADRMTKVWGELNVPESLVKMISGNLSTTKEKTHACVDLYLNYYPWNEPSWRGITRTLYDHCEMAAAREAKPFYHENDPTLTVENVTAAIEKVTMDNRREVWEEVLGEDAVEVIYSSHSSEEERLYSCADTYVSCTPDSSWKVLVWRLYNYGEMAAAKEAIAYLQQKDPSLTVGNVTTAIEKVTMDKRREMWEYVLGEDAVEVIYSSHSSEEERLHSCADTYATCKPDSSWEELVQLLYACDEMAAAKESKAFLQQKDPTLTVENVTAAIEKVTMDNRREVWEEVLGEDAVEVIYSSHSSEEERLHSCADTYVTCKLDSSWEDLVKELYDYGEMAAAKEAKAFLQQKDPTLTVGNVSDVMKKVTVDERRQVWVRVLGWSAISHVEKVYSSHSSEKEKTHACSDTYINCHPESSWEDLTSRLYKEDEMTAVDQARPFLPPRDLTLTTDRLTELFQSVEDPDSVGFVDESMGELLGLPKSALEEISRSYQSWRKRKDAYLDTFMHHHPCPSWKKISGVLRECNLNQQAHEVENTYVQADQAESSLDHQT